MAAPGVLCYGYYPKKNYDFCGANEGIGISPPLRVPAGAPKLTIQLYLDVEPGMGYDTLEVAISNGGGTVQKVLWDKSKAAVQKSWSKVAIDLSPWKNPAVRAIFRFRTRDDSFHVRLGVLTDDLAVEQSCPAGP